MKKTSVIFALVLVLAMLFAGCNQAAAPTQAPTAAPTEAPTEAPAEHTHEFTQWAYDVENHWYECACGEILQEAHVADDWGYCDICGTTVSMYEDGSYCIISYDEQGSMREQIDFDAEGNVLFTMTLENAYYDDGNPKHIKEFHDGLLLYETYFQPVEGEEGTEVYVSEEITYTEDGKMVMKYGEDHLPLSNTIYDEASKAIIEEVYTYERDEAGNVLKTACHTNGVLSMLQEAFVGPDGTVYDSCYLSYNNGVVDNEVRYEYKFADDGSMTYQAIYTNGFLADESFYEQDSEGWYYLAYTISYNEDGEIVEELRYDADGILLEPDGE